MNLFDYSDEQQVRMSANIPVGRVGHMDERSAMTVYLAAKESDFVTGQVLRIDGGLLNA